MAVCLVRSLKRTPASMLSAVPPNSYSNENSLGWLWRSLSAPLTEMRGIGYRSCYRLHEAVLFIYGKSRCMQLNCTVNLV
jgi:hypothetical protein